MKRCSMAADEMECCEVVLQFKLPCAAQTAICRADSHLGPAYVKKNTERCICPPVAISRCASEVEVS